MRAALRAVLLAGTSTGLDLNFAGGVFSLTNTRTDSPAAIPGWSFSRTDTNGTATALDLAGNVIQFATGVPRITNRGILVEEARTNLLLWSRDFTHWSWTKISGATAPSANTVSLTAGYQSRIEQIISVNTGQSAVFQCRLSGSGDIRLSIVDNGGVFGNTYIDVTLTATPTTYSVVRTIGGSGLTSCIARLGTAAAGAAVTATADYADAGLGAFATSPIITTGAAGTRDGETVSLGTAALPPEGTIILTYVVQPTAVGTAARTYGFNLTDAGNSRFSLRIGDSGLATTPVAIMGDGAALTTLTGSSLTPGTTAKVAVSYSSLSAQFAMAVNGSDQTGARQAVAATLALTFRLGSIGTPGTNAINSPIARAQIIPRFLSAAERIALTAP